MADITIVRAPRGEEQPYFLLRRATAQDNRLSFEARGVLAYLLSKPDDWAISPLDLQRAGQCGRDRIKRIIKELQDARYLRSQQERGEAGKFSETVYVLYEDPQPFTEKPSTAKPSTENPLTDDPLTDDPLTENPPHTYKQILQNPESQITESTESDSSSAPVDSAPARADESPADDETRFIQAQIPSFNLFPANQERLLELPRLEAIALMLEARRQARTGDGGSLLATMLGNGTGRTALALQLAPLAAELGTLDWSTLDTALRKRELADLNAATQALLHPKTEKISDLPDLDSLNTAIGATGSLTIADAWRAALGQLRVQLSPATYDGWIAGAKVLRFADGTLTIQARNVTARDQLDQRLRPAISLALNRFAETPITLEFV